MKNRKGFSIVELLVVIAILGVVLSVASLSWQSYVTKTNLRSGARKVASDLTKYRTRAIGEGRVYTITFNATDKYDISAPAQDNFAVVNISETPIEASGAHDAIIENSNFTGCHVVRMTPRGLVGHCNPQVANQSDTGTVTLKNSRDVTATITLNSRGTVDVTFTD